MNEHLRPIESSSIDAGLRTRLEGDVELLEDALPLLESLVKAFGREEPSSDDLETFRECVAQLPAIDEALERVNKHEQATALTRAVGEKKRAAFEAGNGRLQALGQSAEASLKAVTEQVLARSRRLGRRPGEGELRLAGSAGFAFGRATFLAALPAVLLAASGQSGLAAAVALAVFFGSLFLSPRHEWVLLPDRLYLPPTEDAPARERRLQDVLDAELTENGVRVRFEDEALHLRTSEGHEVRALLLMLSGAELGALQSPAQPYTVLEGFDDEEKLEGKVLVSSEGVLFVTEERQARVQDLLGERRVPIERVLALLAHLPAARANEVGARLAEKTGVTWIPRAEVTVERSQVDTVHAVIAGAGKRIRVKLSAVGKAAEWFKAAQAIGRL